MKQAPMYVIGSLVLLVFLLLFSVFTIRETERGLLLRFGEIVNPDLKPGLHISFPWDDVQRVDTRNQTLDAPPTPYLTADKEYLDVDAYIVWRVIDVQKFYVSTNNSNIQARSLLERRALDVLKNKVAERSMEEVISGEREQLMAELTRDVTEAAERELGVQVLDIRVKRVDFPKETIGNVYEEMRSDLNRIAELYRAEGRRDATKIRADADRQSEILIAQGEGESKRIRGEGDAEAAGIYAAAYSKNPEFYKFYRSVMAYENSFSSKQDIMVISPDSEFFDYLKSAKP